MTKKITKNQADLIKFFDNAKEGIRELEFILNGNLHTYNRVKRTNIENVTYICPNFDTYLNTINETNTPAKEILNLLKQKAKKNIAVKIYSFEYSVSNLLQPNMMKHYYIDKNNKKSNKKTEGSIEVFCLRDESNPIIDFTNNLKQLAKENAKEIDNEDKDFDSLDEMADCLIFFDKKNKEKTERLNEKFYNELNRFKEAMKNYINNINECEYYDDNIKSTIIQTLNIFFDEIKNNIIDIKKDGNNFIAKEIIKFFISLIDFTDIKGIFKRYTILPAFLDLTDTATSIYNFKDNQIRYAYLLPLYKVLNQKIAMYINLCKTYFCSHFFIVNETNIIDFSGINIFQSLDNKAILNKGSGFVGIVNDKTPFMDFLENNNANPNKKYNNNCIAKTHHANNTDTLGKYISQTFYKSILLNYIEYSSFASSLLGEILQNKNNNALAKNDNTLPSNPNGLNYLVISNASSYENAELESEIMQHFLGYKIKKIGQNKKISSHYKPNVDYSRYNIDRQNSKVCVVRLSPFVCLKKSDYDRIKGIANSRECEDESLETHQQRNKAKHIITHINSFFKQPKEVKEIASRGKTFFEQYINNMQDFLESIHTNKTPNEKEKKYFYSISEILLISISLYHIKNELKNYGKHHKIQNINKIDYINYDTFPIIKHTFYQAIQCESIEINFIAQNAYIKLPQNNGNDIVKRVFLNKLLKDSLDKNINDDECIFLDMLIIENTQETDFENQIESELVEYLNINIDENFINYIKYEQNFMQEYERLEKEFKNKCSNLEPKNYDLLEQGFEHLIYSMFPFMDYLNLDNWKFIKRLLKNILKQQSLRRIIKEELGLAYLAILLGETKSLSVINTHSIIIRQSFKMMIISEKYALMSEKLSEAKIEITTQKNISKWNRFKLFSKNYLIAYTNQVYKQALQDMGKSIVLNFIDKHFCTTFERLESQYRALIFENFTYKYNEPYAVKQQKFITYPLEIDSNFMCFDFKKIFYGGELYTGGLKYFLGFSYMFDLPHFRENLVKRILYFIALDYHRHNDTLENYINELKSPKTKSSNLECNELDNIFMPNNEPKYYKISNDGVISNNPKESPKMQQELYNLYKKREKTKNSEGKQAPSAIDAYNEALDILQDIYDNTLHNKKHKDDDKMRRLLECLELIGQNNIWAMYIEEKDEKRYKGDKNTDKERPPYFIGRLATTIIRDGGLWIG